MKYIASNLGMPRVGRKRELKFIIEKYWRGEASISELTSTAEEVVTLNNTLQAQAGINPTTVNDFIAGNWGYDRRNTFTPASGDQFLIRRSDNNDWRRFVVTTWSPTANSVCLI